MTKKIIFGTTVALLLAFAGPVQAETSVGGSIAYGDEDSTAFGANVRQSYDPLFSSEIAELQPFVDLGVFGWTEEDTVWGASLSPGLRLTLFTTAPFQPYLAGSVGGAVVSDEKFESRDLGSNVLFKTQGAAGIRFGENMNHRIQGEYTNYSTWGITDTDDGYNTFGVSYGYSF